MSTPESIKHLTLSPDDNQRLARLCGQFDEHLHVIERHLGIEINHRGNHFEIIGIPLSVDKAFTTLQQLYEVTERSELSDQKIFLALKSVDMQYQSPNKDIKKKLAQTTIHLPEITVKARTLNQRHYMNGIAQHDINFGIGPSGTGKTFLAVVCAVQALEQQHVNRLILVRPAVEAGESLGFLPGDITQKIDPYLRPLYDALYEMLGLNKINAYLNDGTIEIASLAYMRGRTLNDAFIILDEAQNATCEQMKMFLTRIGFGSKALITGDITQTDLPKKHLSGLRHAIALLKNIDAIHFTFFTSSDVVRHPLVQRIIEAYESEKTDS